MTAIRPDKPPKRKLSGEVRDATAVRASPLSEDDTLPSGLIGAPLPAPKPAESAQPIPAIAAVLQTIREEQNPEQYIADLPGVGAGLLDTLRRLQRPGYELEFDTSSTDPRTAGSYRGHRGAPGVARILLNPAAMEGAQSGEVGAKRFGYVGAERGGDVPALTLAHEALGHGLGEYGGSLSDEVKADLVARGFARLSGRTPGLPYLAPEEMILEEWLKEQMARLGDVPREP